MAAARYPCVVPPAADEPAFLVSSLGHWHSGTLMILRDLSILLIVYALAGLYAIAAYSWLVRGRDDPATPAPGRLGLSVVPGGLLLALANNYLSTLFGSLATPCVV